MILRTASPQVAALIAFIAISLVARVSQADVPWSYDHEYVVYPDVKSQIVLDAVDQGPTSANKRPLWFKLVTPPAKGVLTGFTSQPVPPSAETEGSRPSMLELDYTPEQGFTGTDEFWFTVSNGREETVPFKAVIKVVPPTAPVVEPQIVTLRWGDAQLAPFAVSDDNYDVIQSISTVLPSPRGLIRQPIDADIERFGSFNPSTLVFDTTVLTESPQSPVTDEVLVQATDSTGLTSVDALFQVTVLPNSKPTASLKIGRTLQLPSPQNLPVLVAKFSGLQTISLDGSGSFDPDGDTLRYFFSRHKPTGNDQVGTHVGSPYSPGVVTVSVVVTDGIFSDEATAQAELITQCEAATRLLALVESARPSLASPKQLSWLIEDFAKAAKPPIKRAKYGQMMQKLRYIRRWIEHGVAKKHPERERLLQVVDQMLLAGGTL